MTEIVGIAGSTGIAGSAGIAGSTGVAGSPRERVIALVDRWVALGLNFYPAKEPPFDPEDGGVPPAMWEREPNADGEVRWKAVEPGVLETDIAKIESRIDGPLPPLFRAYLSARCIGPLETPHARLPALWSDAPLRDVQTTLDAWAPLERAGYVAVADDGDDTGPLCLDVRRRGADGDCPIVAFDHEALAALGVDGCRDRAKLLPLAQERWPSFAAMLDHVERSIAV